MTISCYKLLIGSVLYVLCMAFPVFAQPTGTCAPAEAEAFLSAGNVDAAIYNDGKLFFDNRAHYFVPKGGNAQALFAASFLMGGKVDGDLRVAGDTYRAAFWPGPLDAAGNPPADCADFDRIYEINREDISDFQASGTISDNLRDWPWHLGAPVVDGDGDPDNYNLAGGDLPALLGDQMLWWVMNDLGNAPRDGSPVGVEVRVSAFAFQERFGNPFISYLHNTTFYRYEIIYRGGEPLEDAFFAAWADVDLGHAHDSYVGSDTLIDLAYVYNSDEFDEGSGGYGEKPPALGFVVTQGALTDDGERLGMERFTYRINGVSGLSDPGSGIEKYNMMQSLWNDGAPLIPYLTGRGEQTGLSPVHFAFPARPGDYWSTENADGRGRALTPGNWKMMLSTGPVTLQPGEVQDFRFAIVWSRGANRLDSVRRLRSDATVAKNLAENFYTPLETFAIDGFTRPPDPEDLPGPDEPLGFAQNYPNPFSDRTIIRYSVPRPGPVQLNIYDLLGRPVTTLVDEEQEAGLHEIAFETKSLPSGVYIYEMEYGPLIFTRRMIVMK